MYLPKQVELSQQTIGSAAIPISSDLIHHVHDVDNVEIITYHFIPLYTLQGISTGAGDTDHWRSLSAKGKLICLVQV
jgi:hypothetical protein